MTDDEEKKAIRSYFGDAPKGFFIEVGANDPKGGSQTWHLEERGWNGLLVEPMSDFYERLCQERPGSKVFHAACTAPGKTGTGTLYIPDEHGFATTEKNVDDKFVEYLKEETVRFETLDALLEECGCDGPVDFVSIDVEGTELEVLKGFTLNRWKPQLLLVEDKLTHLGKHRHLVGQGYRLYRRTLLNNWYVPADKPLPSRPFGERLSLFRKVFLGMPFRQFRAWKNERKRLKQK